MRTYDRLWQQEELSDVEIVLTSQHQSNISDSTQDNVVSNLVAFPGHGVLLSESPFFRAQILRWQNKRQHGEAFDTTTEADEAATVSPTSHSSRKTQLVLTLEDADQQPAALAVLQALYFVQPGSRLLSDLTQEQLLQAALLADMWQVPGADTAAADALAAAADGQLSEAVSQQVMCMQAVPTCLESLVTKVLLSVFGDLEAVWADQALRKQLLELPLPAVKLLLSSDKLKVASEDTVLYTVRCFVEKIIPGSPEPHTDPQALQQLMPLVRCPHLSAYWLSALATSRLPVPAELLPHLSNFLAARSFNLDFGVPARHHLQWLSDVPASWTLPKRAAAPAASSVQVEWNVPIAQLRGAGQRSIANSTIFELKSPHTTPPIHGMAYMLCVACLPQASSCIFRVRVIPSTLPDGLCWSFDSLLEIPSAAISEMVTARIETKDLAWGWGDSLLPVMAGGWDEAAWAANGLPTSGTLTIKLTVYAHSQPRGAFVNARRNLNPAAANLGLGGRRG